jgi:putative hydrolase of the HAD superfamily
VISFDLDGTLCAYERPVGDVLVAAFDRAGVEPFFDADDYRTRFDEFADRTDGPAELRRECFAALAAERGRDAETGRRIAAAYEEQRDQRNVRALPGARETVERVAESARPLALVTNGPRAIQTTKLDALGLRERFDVVVCGGEDAPPKPAPEPFERALDATGIAPEDALHVGDSAEDVRGARAAGVESVLVGEPVGVEPDRRVGSLAEL